MDAIIFIAGILALAFGAIFCFLGYSGIQKKKEIEEENRRIEEENQQLIKTNTKLDTMRSNLESKNRELAQEALERAAIATRKAAEQQKIMADSLAQYCDTLEAAYLAEENKFDLKVAHLTDVYEQMQERLSDEYEQDKKTTREAFNAYVEILCGEYSKVEEQFDKELAKMNNTIALKKGELDEIASTWRAAKEAQIREEEMLLKYSDINTLCS